MDMIHPESPWNSQQTYFVDLFFPFDVNRLTIGITFFVFLLLKQSVDVSTLKVDYCQHICPVFPHCSTLRTV